MTILPDFLRERHEDGQIVFFCGAGVSAPELPVFKNLTQIVLEDRLPDRDRCEPGSMEALAWKAFDEDAFDVALDILENRLAAGFNPADIRAVVRRILSRRVRQVRQHEILTKLCDLDREGGRLVTTNFDHLFERAHFRVCKAEKFKHKLTNYIAPALPPAKPAAWNGLVYLHGKLDATRDNRGLVLTQTNFGTAYLLEGWASRFVIELFNNFHVVFLGYRVEDPTMRYLVSAIAAARAEGAKIKEPYAFAPYGPSETAQSYKEAEREWQLKGLTPIVYDASGAHSQLWNELGDWANDHRQGVLGRRQKAVEVAQFPPAHSNDPAIGELSRLLKDPEIARFFVSTDSEKRVEPIWIPFFQREGLLSLPIGISSEGTPIQVPLVGRLLNDGFQLNEATWQLGRWIANCLDRPEAIAWALSQGAVLHSAFRQHIQFSLERARQEKSIEKIPEPFRKLWATLASEEYAYALSIKHQAQMRFPTEPKVGEKNKSANLQFLARLQPIPIFKPREAWYGEEEKRNPERMGDYFQMDLVLVGVDKDFDIEQMKKKAEDWEGGLAALAQSITARLKEAMDWFEEFDKADSKRDPSVFDFRSINEHSQNQHSHAWTWLIRLARDSFDALERRDKSKAMRLLESWRDLKSYPIFRRLALHAVTGSGDE